MPRLRPLVPALVALLALLLPAGAHASFPPTFLGDSPKEREEFWTHEAQGLAHHRDSWIFTQPKRLWFIPLGYDLRQGRSQPLGERIARIEMPDALTAGGYDHFGDPDVAGDMLYVPVTGPRRTPVIAAFHAPTRSFIGHFPLAGLSGAGWVAVHPNTGELWTSNNHIDERDPALGVLRRYRVLDTRPGRFRLAYAGTGGVLDEKLRPLRLVHMQGGAWTPDGARLYLVNGFPRHTSDNDAIHVFQPRGSAVRRIARSRDGHGPFNFQFDETFPNYQEPEGLDWLPLDNGRAPGIRGELHVILLDNDASHDDVYFKHYDAN